MSTPDILSIFWGSGSNRDYPTPPSSFTTPLLPSFPPSSHPLLCTLHFNTHFLFSSAPSPLSLFLHLLPLPPSHFFLHLPPPSPCTSLLHPSSRSPPLLLPPSLPPHSHHLLPTSPFLNFPPSPLLSLTRRSGACWVECRSLNSWLNNIIIIFIQTILGVGAQRMWGLPDSE